MAINSVQAQRSRYEEGCDLLREAVSMLRELAAKHGAMLGAIDGRVVNDAGAPVTKITLDTKIIFLGCAEKTVAPQPDVKVGPKGGVYTEDPETGMRVYSMRGPEGTVRG